MTETEWPVLRSYDAEHQNRISLPVGGIGTGQIGFGGRGQLRDWQLRDTPEVGRRPAFAAFCLRTRTPDGVVKLRALEGAFDDHEYSGPFGSPVANHGLPKFAEHSYAAAYPLGQVELHDDAVPLDVTVQSFNPLIPTNADDSSWPVMVLRYLLHNPGNEPVEASVVGSLSNYLAEKEGEDAASPHPAAVNEVRRCARATGVRMSDTSLPAACAAAGNISLAVLDGQDVTVQRSWRDLRWMNMLSAFLDDFADDGALDEDQPEGPVKVGSVCTRLVVEPGQTKEATFVIAWSFPNRRAWLSKDHGDLHHGRYAGPKTMTDPIDPVSNIGNAYALRHPDSWHTIEEFAVVLPGLERSTVGFVRSVIESDMPAAIREAALFNLSTLRSQTLFQIADGEYYAWEGVGERAGSCYGSCSHVWAYEFATTFLFPQISRSMRRVQFQRSMESNGFMAFRAGLPLPEATSWRLAAADGQMASLVKLYADWRLSGDDQTLRTLWEPARRAMEFAWIEGGWDGDHDGVMEGPQHNTMDVEYFGPNPMMTTWYLAALDACTQMASHVGDVEFAETCAGLARRGAAWVDENLFNGEYYEHQIRPVPDPGNVHPLLVSPATRSPQNLAHPELQVGSACIIDQLVGRYAARTAGLDPVLDDAHAKRALAAVKEYNYRPSLREHVNQMRGFALDDEAAVLMGTYPHGGRLESPFPYLNEVMTGFEYTAAVGMIQEGLIDDGVQVIESIRSRYDGRRRNPFDEAECGSHYARAMSSWSAIIAWSGFSYDAISQTMSFSPVRPMRQTVWSAAGAWGTIEFGDTINTLRVGAGELKLSCLVVNGVAVRVEPQTLGEGEVLSLAL